MNKHLQQRVEELLTRYDCATLATCGQTGPQISRIAYRSQHLDLYLFVPLNSDHLFHLETQPALVLLSPEWQLHGRGMAKQDSPMAAPYSWQTVITVEPVRLHILGEDGQSTVETIDF